MKIQTIYWKNRVASLLQDRWVSYGDGGYHITYTYQKCQSIEQVIFNGKDCFEITANNGQKIIVTNPSEIVYKKDE